MPADALASKVTRASAGMAFAAYTGIARLFGVYVPLPHIAPILCALLCEKGKNG